ncbi:putative methyltransferase-domain-containing protein [Mycena capillaripes]|nr:putative methyltransferase-domain-containing protein [Mycena capillaripes]
MLPTQLPSHHLPPLRGLASLSSAALIDCIEYLRVLYTPGIRGSKIWRRFSANSSSEPEALSLPLHVTAPSGPSVDLDNTDEFERAYAIRWLTYLINNAERVQGTSSDVESVIKRAASLLANFGGASSAGVISRVLVFPSAHGPISITLQDIPLENGDMASVGAQTWGGACVLAELLAAESATFGLAKDRPTPLRVLELGAGTGLVGLALTAVAKLMDVDVAVVCTDFYPSVLQNLAANITANFPASDRSILSHFLDWSSFVDDANPIPPPLDQLFDVILGADIIYEAEHATWIHACVSRLLDREKPSQFHLVIPLRPTHTLESNTIELVFGAGLDASGLTILSKETIVCGVEESPSEEVEYAYYRIGWKRQILM